ncbi:3-hydroxyacyl-CoA dehydrogenase/enoyl-CoA hydratase family protein [Halobacterium noricense]|uniref:3-hydroxyacyl-CoA dehydrogenase/enoyl-CoA hydratase family protein n=1 Tax=Halobacterium noricense TaxID=223182 RepID=UPI001E35B823|nr:3-hydroxyacyl-CoA dehydrogenase NAD-binding domain-containing protein [Halobacterium noricense]UHH23960.1 3-hydroxyacyl-CoA dehydrogenase NAD-binding domain-containing protein [Halobacterium noricense]
MTVSQLDISAVTVLGAGSMGHGIAEVASIAGYDVVLRDVKEEYVQDGYEQLEWSVEKLAEKGQVEEDAGTILNRIETTTDLDDAVADADIVIEAAPENLDLKQDIFSNIEAATDENTIIATNTSSLRVSDIASETERPARCCGLHFFNPPVKMDLVEVVSGEATAESVAEAAYEFAESLDKTPIRVQKDVPEFVVNNVLTPFMEEAGWMLDDGSASIEGVDAAMVYERGYPMGPCELNDFGGLDVLVHTREQWKNPIPESVHQRFEAEELGRKTGQGFYDYEDGDGVSYVPEDAEGVDTLRIEARMVNAAARLVGESVASPEAIDIGMRLGGRFPEGTCRTGDKVGLDRVLEKLESLHDETGADRYEPADYLVELVENGQTGEEAGEGFYDYTGDGPYFYVNHELDDRGVLHVTLDRQERLNAFNDDMFAEVETLLTSVDTDEVQCVVFAGAGDTFSAGADVSAFPTMEPAEMMDVDESMVAVAEFDRPTIAKIDGHCLGAGLELSLACDFRIATEDSTLGAPEIDLGLIPGGGGTQRLVRLVGEPLAKELILRGKHIPASKADDWNLVHQAVASDDLDEAVGSYISDMVQGPPIALKVAKDVINTGRDVDLESGLKLEKQGFSTLMTTDDMVEGVTAFREDRDPHFEGR